MEHPRPAKSMMSTVEKKVVSKKKKPQEQFEQQQLLLLMQLKHVDINAENCFETLMQMIKQMLVVMELDIFIPALYLQPHNPLTKTILIVEKVIDEKTLTGNELAQIFACLSTNNLKQYYDKTWLYEEKNLNFKAILQKIIDKVSTLFSATHLETKSLKDEKTLETTSNKHVLSPFAIASLMKNASLWDLKPSELWVEQLRETMELAVLENKDITKQIAYDFIYGFLRLNSDYKTVGKPKQAEFFAHLATHALPLLLEDEPPLEMFQIKNLALSRIYHIKALLPQPDYSRYRTEFLQAIYYLNKTQGSANLNALSQYLPDYVIPHKTIVVALEEKYEALLQEQWGPFDQDTQKTPKKSKETGKINPDTKKVHFSLEIYIKFIRLIRNKNNPKALQWIIIQYSKGIANMLKNSLHTYFADDIREFLKILRQCIWDTTLPDVIHTIKILSQEALLDIHAKSIDGALALDLLWINVVLSTVISDEHLAYTIEEQQKLFTKIQTLVINPDQARALYEIKAMQWTGGLTFSSKLVEQMKSHLKEFDKGSSPSDEEELYFEKIKLCLPKNLQTFLKKNYICPETGHEIDIAFLGSHKVAIHIDGPSHFDAITGIITLKTIFRDRCLEAAQWQNYSIKLSTFITDPDLFDQLMSKIVVSLEAIASPQQPLSPKTQRVFAGLGQPLTKSFTIDDFEKNVEAMSYINRNNQGKVGDTALAQALRYELDPKHQQPKVKVLLKLGALWYVPNRQGKTAATLAEQHEPKLIAELKKTPKNSS